MVVIEHYQKVVPGLFIGDIYAASDLELLTKLKISHIVNLSQRKPKFQDQFFYLNIDIADSERSNLKRYFNVTNWLIQGAINGGNNVFVHCAAGISRSATIVLAYLLFKNKQWTPTRAYEFLRSKRPIVHPNEGFQTQLNQWWLSRNPQQHTMNNRRMPSPPSIRSPGRKPIYSRGMQR